MALIEGFTREKCLLLGKPTILDVVPRVTTSLFKIDMLGDKCTPRCLWRRWAAVTAPSCPLISTPGQVLALPDECEHLQVRPGRDSLGAALTSGAGLIFNARDAAVAEGKPEEEQKPVNNAEKKQCSGCLGLLWVLSRLSALKYYCQAGQLLLQHRLG